MENADSQIIKRRQCNKIYYMYFSEGKNHEREQALELLSRYVTEVEPSINKQLRCDIANSNNIALLDSLFTYNNLPQYVYRWMPSVCVNIKQSIMVDKAYLSCSKSVDIYLQHVSEADISCVRIQTDNKHKSIIVHDLLPDRNDEEEIILPHNLTVTIITDKQYDKNEFTQFLTDIECSEIRPNALTDIFKIERIRFIDAKL